MPAIELYRSSAQTWETDGMGHMNVQFYSEKATAALSALSLALGHGRDAQTRTHLRLTPKDHHIRFLREQRPGAPIFIQGGVVRVEGDRLICYFEMVNTVSQEVAATFLTEAAFVDIRTGEEATMPACIAAQIATLQVDVPTHGAPRGLVLSAPRPAPLLGEAEEMKLIQTFKGEVLPEWCDITGRLAIRRYMGIVSDSIPNLLAQPRGDDRSKDSKIGGAALEYRFVYRAAPLAGDIVVLRSGLKIVTDKTYTWAHWLFNAETGACVATAEAVAIALDLVLRKSIPIPAEMKAHLTSFVVEGLGV
ncbi:MAG: thioesterase family protein [Parvibaculum sp.]